MKRMPIRGAALDWWKVDRLAALLARVHPVTRVDYRELCASPHTVLAGALAAMGVDLAEGPRWLAPDVVQPGEGYHSLNGNPDRFDKGTLRIALREADWSRIAPSERPVIRATATALRLLSPSGHKPASWS